MAIEASHERARLTLLRRCIAEQRQEDDDEQDKSGDGCHASEQGADLQGRWKIHVTVFLFGEKGNILYKK